MLDYRLLTKYPPQRRYLYRYISALVTHEVGITAIKYCNAISNEPLSVKAYRSRGLLTSLFDARLSLIPKIAAYHMENVYTISCP